MKRILALLSITVMIGIFVAFLPIVRGEERTLPCTSPNANSGEFGSQGYIRLLLDFSAITEKSYKGQKIYDLEINDSHEIHANGIDFSNCEIRHISLGDAYAQRCNFSGSTIYAGGICVSSETIDFAGARFGSGVRFCSSNANILLKLKNFKEKYIPFSFINCTFNNVDFSDFVFENEVLGRFPDCNFSNARFQKGVIGGLNQQQLQSTWNYRNKIFSNCTIWGQFSTEPPRKYSKPTLQGPDIPFSGMDLSQFIFTNCTLTGFFTDTDLTDAMFIQSDLRGAENLTVEQVKSTWNYKTGHMDLSQWPERIQKALEAEKEGNTP